MGRHSAPEGRHRRNGALLAQAALVAVLALVTVSVLIGSGMARDRMVDGTFASSETADRESPRVEAPDTAPEPSTTASEKKAAPGAVTPSAADPVSPLPSDSSDGQAKPTGSREGSGAATPTTSTRASSSMDTTTTPSISTTEPAQKFSDCAEAKAASVSMIPSTDPRYAPKLDRDHDGFACDAHGDPPTTSGPPTPSTEPSTSTTPTTSEPPTTTSAPRVKPASDYLGS